jgi:hypothetical protein
MSGMWTSTLFASRRALGVFEIIDCFLLRGEALDSYRLKLDDEIFHVMCNSFNRWKNGAMNARSAWSVGHCTDLNQPESHAEIIWIFPDSLTKVIWETGNSSAEMR